MNMTVKYIFAHVETTVYPEKRGNQWTNLPIIVNTAHMDRVCGSELQC